MSNLAYIGDSALLSDRNYATKAQYAAADAAPAIIEWIARVRRRGFPTFCVNEAHRTEARQTWLYRGYKGKGINPETGGRFALAAVPNSASARHQISATGLDVGEGRNAVSPACHAVAVAEGAALGIDWTGAAFGEWWHFDKRRDVEFTSTAALPAKPLATVKDLDMTDILAVVKRGSNIVDYRLQNLVTRKSLSKDECTFEAAARGMSLGMVPVIGIDVDEYLARRFEEDKKNLTAYSK